MKNISEIFWIQKKKSQLNTQYIQDINEMYPFIALATKGKINYLWQNPITIHNNYKSSMYRKYAHYAKHEKNHTL